jgi:hypothetical protein
LKTANNAWVWTAFDFSDPEAKCEKFAVRLINKDEYEKFSSEFEKAIDLNHKVPPTASPEDRNRYLEDQEKERRAEQQKKKG